MKNISKFTVLLMAVFMMSLTSCMKRIDAGHTGILFNYYGITDEKGVSDHSEVSGVVWYNPITRGVYEYPHFWQDVEYEHISFNSLEGEPIKTAMKAVYRFNRDSIPALFDEYREGPKELKYGIIESIILEELSAQAGKLSAVDIMGRQREQLLTAVTNALNEKYSKYMEFDLVTFTSDLVPSENVKQAVQGVIQAQEKAKSAQARTIEVEEAAKQQIINARADSTARVIRAAGEAKEIELVQRQLSSNPQYIQYIQANKWDGTLPQVSGGAIPMLQLK